MSAPSGLRWRLADDDGGQPTLFPLDDEVPGRRELPAVEYLHVRARRLISSLPESGRRRLPFGHTINVYRGCAHACTYCFARPTHEHIGLGAGEDFERRIVVKINAVERVRAELSAPRWAGELIAMGTNTDPYQPAEGRYRLTRGVIGELVAAGNPFSILTKSPMVTRDLDLLEEAAARGLVRCSFSIGTLDEDVARATEPSAPPPHQRVEALRRLAEAGVPVSVLVAPVLPGISDAPDQLETVIRAVVDAGADSVHSLLLHLRPGVKEVFMPWLADYRPDLVDQYERRYDTASGYLPRRDQEAHAARVREILARCGGAASARRGR
jgi:DNA repair photolyase